MSAADRGTGAVSPAFGGPPAAGLLRPIPLPDGAGQLLV